MRPSHGHRPGLPPVAGCPLRRSARLRRSGAPRATWLECCVTGRNRGWSYGGLAAIAVIRRCDVFRAAVTRAAPSVEATGLAGAGARTYRRGWPEGMLNCLYLG